MQTQVESSTDGHDNRQTMYGNTIEAGRYGRNAHRKNTNDMNIVLAILNSHSS